MNCEFCGQKTDNEYAPGSKPTGGYYCCNRCLYRPRFNIDNVVAGTYVIDFRIFINNKYYYVVFWKIPGINKYNITEPETRIYHDGGIVYREKGRLISSPQDAFYLLQRVLKLKPFL